MKLSFVYPKPVLPGFATNEIPLLIEFTDKSDISVGYWRRRYSLCREFFNCANTYFQRSYAIANPGGVEGHINDLLFNAGLPNLISIGQLEYRVAFTTAETRVLTMTVD